MPVQKYLQDAFLAAWLLLASAVGDLDAVIGFEVRVLVAGLSVACSSFARL